MVNNCRNVWTPYAAWLNDLGKFGALMQAHEERLTPLLSVLAQIDCQGQRLKELPAKSKEAMIFALSKGWFFGWQDYLEELIALIGRLGEIEEGDIDALMQQYYRDRIRPFTDELVKSYPNRSSAIRAAVRAHSEFGNDGYFLSIPVFIAQADGLLADITGVSQPMQTVGRKYVKVWKALDERLAMDQASKDLVLPIQRLHELNLLKSADERQKVKKATGESFTALNRHQVMHGESSDYGTEINSLRAFSFLAFVGLHLPMILETSDLGSSSAGQPEGSG